MKIVFFDFVFIPGGAPSLAVDMARRLSARHDVQIVDAYGGCEPYLKEVKEAGIESHILCPESKDLVGIGHHGRKLNRLRQTVARVPGFVRLRQRLIRKMRAIKADVIWTNSPRALLFLNMSFPTLRYPLVMYECGCRDSREIRGCDRWLLKQRTAIVMAICTEAARQLEGAGVPRDRIRVVFDAIDSSSFLRASTAPLEGSLPGSDRKLRILLPARLLEGKGQHTAIQAIRRLKSEGLNPTLWLAGSATEGSRAYEARLRRMVEEWELTDNVYFLGWRRDVAAIMRQADIVTLPTHSEGFGHVILEAMLLRRPVVATHVGGIKDSIEDGTNGLVFPVDDDEMMAAQLKRLALDKRLVSALIENGSKTVAERFTPELHTKRVDEALACAAGLESQRIPASR